MKCNAKLMKIYWIGGSILYWVVIAIIIIICLFCKGEISKFGTTDFYDKNTYFHIENITLGFIGCFIGGLSVSIVGIIFSYGLIFKSLFELISNPKLNPANDIKEKIKDIIKRGHEIEDAVRIVIYFILYIVIILSLILGAYLIFSPWGVEKYIFLKGLLLFLLVGIVPVFIAVILALLRYPGAPLKQLLYAYYRITHPEEKT